MQRQAGWYTDSVRVNTERWFDGKSWTGRLRAAPSPVVAMERSGHMGRGMTQLAILSCVVGAGAVLTLATSVVGSFLVALPH